MRRRMFVLFIEVELKYMSDGFFLCECTNLLDGEPCADIAAGQALHDLLCVNTFDFDIFPVEDDIKQKLRALIKVVEEKRHEVIVDQAQTPSVFLFVIVK